VVNPTNGPESKKDCRMGVYCSSGTQCGPGMTGRRMSWRGRYELSGEFVIEWAGEDTERWIDRWICSSLFYCTFTTQFISWCLLQLVLSHIDLSIHLVVSSPAHSITNSPVNSALCIFSSLLYRKFTTQFISWCLLQFILSQIHLSIQLSVSSPAHSITN
jgi:hypothetical protein